MINDSLAVLEASQGWKEIVAAVGMKRCPQSVAVVLPETIQKMFVENYGKLILGDSPVWKDGADIPAQSILVFRPAKRAHGVTK